MNITVKLFATLRENRFEQQQISLNKVETVSSVIASLDIPKKDISIIFLNGRHSALEQQLNDGDTLSLFPPVGGG